ncbi:MAG: hypothetical protein GY757_50750 [bacterium]|nr:hypothetical protein [bacterium]
MTLLGNILSNGFIPIIPVLVWNLLLTSKLPPAYQPKIFDKNIPPAIIMGETILRVIVFFMPLLFTLNITTYWGKLGLITFLIGAVIYFSSWLMLIYASESGWSTSLAGFSAPAYTPLIWLIGLSLMADTYYFEASYSSLHYIVPAILFSIFHTTHTVYVYNRNYK